MSNIVIIGSGPAGVSAALYTARAGVDTTVLTRGPGALDRAELIQNYYGFAAPISGAELERQGIEGAKAVGVKFVTTEAVGLTYTDKLTVETLDGDYPADAVILATGASRATPRIPGLAGLEGHGVSYCATCDGFFFKDKDVCVVGGGDVAVEEALYLTKMCRSVTLFHRRDALRANKRSQELALANDKLHIEWDTIVTELLGDDKLSQVVTENVKTGETKTWDFPGCFIFVGYDPNNEVVPSTIKGDANNYILTDDNMATNIPGVYAIGDVRSKTVRQIASAVGDAGIVMYDIERYFREGGGQ